MKPLPVAAVAAALVAGACGYRFTTASPLHGGVERATVAPFENLSAEPELGAAVAAALREELARRGAAGEGAIIEGEVRAGEPAPTAPRGPSYRVAVEVRARLRVGGKVVAERTVRSDSDYVAGADALETEGRRALALRRATAGAAREIVRALGR